MTIEYCGPKATRVDTVVVSTQHSPEVTHEEIREYVVNQIINPVLPKDSSRVRSRTTSIPPAGSSWAVRTATAA